MASDQAAAVCDALHEFALKGGLLDAELDVAKTREAMASLGALPIPVHIAVEEVRVAARPALWVTPRGADESRCVLHLHGGAYTSGGLASHRSLAAAVAGTLSMPVLLLDYRLAPEHPFPAGLDDAVAAFEWLVTNGPSGQRHAVDTYISGDSAGGGLAVATALALRDKGAPMPTAIAAMSGWLDLTSTREDMAGAIDDPIVGVGWAADSANAYAGSVDPRNPGISPSFGEYGETFSPILLQVGTRERLHEQNRVFAQRAKAQGSRVRLEVWEEMFHSWHTCGPALPEAGQAIEQIRDFFAECGGTPVPDPESGD
jgi:monoterpene epsilon-lactone hydrolase